MTVPDALEIIKELRKAYRNGEVLIGAGTVLDPETARLAILAGAEFIISPNLNVDVIKMCNRYRKLVVPGVMTITEIIKAMEHGADFVKLFPGSVLGPSYVKAVKGPVPQARVIPTGGVSLKNVKDWFEQGCDAVAIGSELTAGAKTNNYQKITETAVKFFNEVETAKNRIEGPS